MMGRLSYLLRRQLWSKSMRAMADSIEQVTAAFRDQLTPALDEVTFVLQRWGVEYLNSEPWYRHWRSRWALRRARRWDVR